MDAKSLIRLACPLVTVDSPKKAIALKVVQILLGITGFNAKFWRYHRYFPYENGIIRLTRKGFITAATQSKIKKSKIISEHSGIILFKIGHRKDWLELPSQQGSGANGSLLRLLERVWGYDIYYNTGLAPVIVSVYFTK